MPKGAPSRKLTKLLQQETTKNPKKSTFTKNKPKPALSTQLNPP
jgi:hypothetical protein